jgi:hypothetical protein
MICKWRLAAFASVLLAASPAVDILLAASPAVDTLLAASPAVDTLLAASAQLGQDTHLVPQV